jgi:hypothetical protein
MQDNKNFFLVVLLCALTLFVGDYVVNKWFSQAPSPQPSGVESSVAESHASRTPPAVETREKEPLQTNALPAKTILIDTPNLQGVMSTRGLLLNSLS